MSTDLVWSGLCVSILRRGVDCCSCAPLQTSKNWPRARCRLTSSRPTSLEATGKKRYLLYAYACLKAAEEVVLHIEILEIKIVLP